MTSKTMFLMNVWLGDMAKGRQVALWNPSGGQEWNEWQTSNHDWVSDKSSFHKW